MDFNFDYPKENQTQYSPNTLIIFYDTLIGKEYLLNAIEEYNATIIYDLKIINSISIKIPENANIEDAIEYFQKVEGVLAVNRDAINQID